MENGIKALEEENYKTAIESFEKALEEEPEDEEAKQKLLEAEELYEQEKADNKKSAAFFVMDGVSVILIILFAIGTIALLFIVGSTLLELLLPFLFIGGVIAAVIWLLIRYIFFLIG